MKHLFFRCSCLFELALTQVTGGYTTYTIRGPSVGHQWERERLGLVAVNLQCERYHCASRLRMEPLFLGALACVSWPSTDTSGYNWVTSGYKVTLALKRSLHKQAENGAPGF